MKRIAAGLVGLGIALNTAAVPITIDFEDQIVGAYPSLKIQGFDFVPGSRMNIQLGSQQRVPWTSKWLGFDAYALLQGPASVTVSSGGKKFSLLSVDPLAMYEDARWTVTSSKGGSYTHRYGAPVTVTFSDPMWTDVEWIMFYEPYGGGWSRGFDNLRLDVPDPESSGVPPVKLKKPKKPKPKKSWF